MDYGLVIFIGTAIVFSLIGILYTWNKGVSVSEYVGSKNSLGSGMLITTLFASGMGAWLLFGPAETSLTAGILGLVGYGLGSLLSLWVFIIVGIRIRKIMPKGHTLTEFILHRFGKSMYTLILLISVFYMVIALTAELTGIALAGVLVFKIPIGVTAAVVGFSVLLYTAVGGFKASVFTDKIQTWIIIPLFGLIVIGSLIFLGGLDVFKNVASKAPQLLGFTPTGLEYGLTLIIAIIGAEFFNQGWWQRVYASKNNLVMKRGFYIAGLMIFPIIIIAGLFGLFAVGTPAAETPSVAMFTFLIQNTPPWIIILTMVLAIALVMSSLDTLLNAIVSIFTVDFVRIKKKANQKKILTFSKWLTVVFMCAAVLVAAKGFSVLYLFLVADLACVAALFPVLFGMYNRSYSGKVGVVSSIIGIVAGLLWFPTPSWMTSAFGALTGSNLFPPNLLWSFLAALLIPVIISVFWRGNDKFDFKSLAEKETELTG